MDLERDGGVKTSVKVTLVDIFPIQSSECFYSTLWHNTFKIKLDIVLYCY